MAIQFLTAVPAILTAIGNSFNRYQERKQAEHEAVIAQERERAQIAKEVIKAELEHGVTQIKATSPIFKYFTFTMWFGPFMLAMILPQYAQTIFLNLNQLPEWYVQSCMIIMFAVWGISAGKETILHVFTGLSNFFQQRQKININKKLFFETLRSTKGNITQAEVELFNSVLDKLNKE